MYLFHFKQGKLSDLGRRLRTPLRITITRGWLVRWFLPSVFAAGAIAAIVIGVVLNASLAFSIVAAVAASLSAGLAWRGGKQQRQIAGDLRRLAELTETSLEDARAQKPEPVVGFLLEDDELAVSVKLEREREHRAIDAEGIVEKERALALATLPSHELREKGFRGFGISSAELMKISAQLGIGGISEQEQRVKFEAQVEKYVTQLRAWIREFEKWRQELSECIRLQLCFENSGRVPTYDARIDVHFPDAFEPIEEEPTLSERPARPRFTRGTRFPQLAGLNHLLAPSASVRPIIPIPSQRNVSRPHYRKGSVHVDIKVTKLLHGVLERSDMITLRVTEDGAYRIPWEIRAENLPEPAHGELEFTIDTVQEEGPPIATLDELLLLIGNQATAEE